MGLDGVATDVGRVAAARRRGKRMSDLTPAPPTNPLARETVTYEDVRIVITPKAPYHYEVAVSETDGDRTDHAVEYVAINATNVLLESPIWFVDADLDVGVPIERAGDTAWVWP